MESKHLPTVSGGRAGMAGGVFQNDAGDVDFCTTELGPEVLFKEVNKELREALANPPGQVLLA